MTIDNFCFYLQNRQIRSSQTGGQRYSNTFPFSIPGLNIDSNFCMLPTEAIDSGENFLLKLERSRLPMGAKNNVLAKASTFFKELFIGPAKPFMGNIKSDEACAEVHDAQVP